MDEEKKKKKERQNNKIHIETEMIGLHFQNGNKTHVPYYKDCDFFFFSFTIEMENGEKTTVNIIGRFVVFELNWLKKKKKKKKMQGPHKLFTLFIQIVK